VKLDLKNDRGDTPLHIASYRGDMRIVKMLLHAQVALWVENDLGYFAGEVFSPDVEEETQRKIRMTLHRYVIMFSRLCY
jgi:ankyrin repeat protein